MGNNTLTIEDLANTKQYRDLYLSKIKGDKNRNKNKKDKDINTSNNNKRDNIISSINRGDIEESLLLIDKYYREYMKPRKRDTIYTLMKGNISKSYRLIKDRNKRALTKEEQDKIMEYKDTIDVLYNTINKSLHKLKKDKRDNTKKTLRDIFINHVNKSNSSKNYKDKVSRLEGIISKLKTLKESLVTSIEGSSTLGSYLDSDINHTSIPTPEYIPTPESSPDPIITPTISPVISIHNDNNQITIPTSGIPYKGQYGTRIIRDKFSDSYYEAEDLDRYRRRSRPTHQKLITKYKNRNKSKELVTQGYFDKEDVVSNWMIYDVYASDPVLRQVDTGFQDQYNKKNDYFQLILKHFHSSLNKHFSFESIYISILKYLVSISNDKEIIDERTDDLTDSSHIRDVDKRELIKYVIAPLDKNISMMLEGFNAIKNLIDKGKFEFSSNQMFLDEITNNIIPYYCNLALPTRIEGTNNTIDIRSQVKSILGEDITTELFNNLHTSFIKASRYILNYYIQHKPNHNLDINNLLEDINIRLNNTGNTSNHLLIEDINTNVSNTNSNRWCTSNIEGSNKSSNNSTEGIEEGVSMSRSNSRKNNNVHSKSKASL